MCCFKGCTDNLLSAFETYATCYHLSHVLLNLLHVRGKTLSSQALNVISHFNILVATVESTRVLISTKKFLRILRIAIVS